MASPVVRQEGWPGILTGAEKDAIGVLRGFFRQRGNVQAARRVKLR
jgi:hypothetical protein